MAAVSGSARDKPGTSHWAVDAGFMNGNERVAWKIGCGMYAFTEPLRYAWQQLLEPLPGMIPFLSDKDDSTADVIFDSLDQTFLSDRLLIGHTCGYPYWKRWQSTHEPVAVPVFEVEGCAGTRYRSWFICHGNDKRRSLPEFALGTVAVNHADSNSGMNVLRYALKDLANEGTFFSRVVMSGSHSESLRMVSRGEVDLASIDAVSYHHTIRLEPSLANNVRIFDSSVFTTGLPFIRPRSLRIPKSEILGALNKSLAGLPPAAQRILRITEFSAVDESSYMPMLQLEKAAAVAGYPDLR